VSQPERERGGRWIAVLAASLAAHLIALSALHANLHAAASHELNAIDVTFSVVAAPQAPSSLEPIAPAIDVPPPRTKPALVARRPSEAPVRPDPRERASPPDLAEANDPSQTPRASESTLSLDPAIVARAFVLSERSAPGEATEATGEERTADDVDAKPPNYFEGVGEKTYLTRREPPKLQRHRDGTYHYRGQAFKAIVAEDGSVDFDDGSRQGSKLVFDLTDMLVRRRGEDPYRVEKRWFLESTEKLRDQLLELWRAKLERRAILKLRGRLIRVFEDDTLTDRQKAAHVVAIFQDTADGDAGTAARSAIAEFVADSMPNVELPAPIR